MGISCAYKKNKLNLYVVIYTEGLQKILVKENISKKKIKSWTREKLILLRMKLLFK